MSKILKWKFVIKSFAAVVLGFIVLIIPFELWNAWTAPHEYPFGAEGPVAGSWGYESQSNYLVANTVMWFASVLALLGLFDTKRSLLLRWFCAAPFLLNWGLSAFGGPGWFN